MKGPYPMTKLVVGTLPAQPGAYALGNLSNRALFVGRADSDLRAKILEHWGPPNPEAAPVERFWYEITVSSWDAYWLECQWYHQYAPTHNFAHPARPFGMPARCPVCGR